MTGLFRSIAARFRRPAEEPPPAEPPRLDETERLQSADLAVWHDPLVRQAYLQMELPLRDIEIDVTDEKLAARLLDRVKEQWRAIGEIEPYFSNLTSDSLRLANITQEGIDDFYAGGFEWLQRTLTAFESRSRVNVGNGICMELGCGAGKYIPALASRFKQVIAIDVSRPLLDVCQSRLDAQNIKNVETVLLETPQETGNHGPIDFFLSLSALQHNAPPIQKMMLDAALSRLNPGGFALFQTPDWLECYTFSSERFLNELPNVEIDCHCFPKTDVIRLFKSHNMELLDFAPDFTVECFGSYTYFARKL